MIMSSCHLVILSSCCPFILSSCSSVIILSCPPEDAPSWLVEPTDTSAGAGDKVTLECRADGNPSPSYIWYRGEQGEQVGGQLYREVNATFDLAGDRQQQLPGGGRV